MWKGHQVPVPRALAACLEEIFGESVAQVRVYEHSLFTRLHFRAIATTRPDRIYLRGSGADFFENPWLLLHEYCHVLRQWAPGSLTIPRYLMEIMRRGYWQNRFEVEARAFADQYLHRVHAALSRAKPPDDTAALRCT